MKRHFHTLLLVLPAILLLGLSACVRKLPLPDLQSLRKMVLLGEMAAGDSLNLRLGQSLPVTQSTKGRPQWPADLEARAYVGNQLLLQCRPAADAHTDSIGTLLIQDGTHIYAGAQYKIQVTGSGFPDVEATVPVPSPFKVALVDTQTVSYNGLKVLQLTFRIYDQEGEKNYYSFEVLRRGVKMQGTFEYVGSRYDIALYYSLYDSLRRAGSRPTANITFTPVQTTERLITYTTDLATENMKLATALSPARRVLLEDASFAGGTHNLKVLVDQSRFIGSAPYDLGQITFYVKSVSPDYFTYLRAYETFTPATSGGYLAQPVRIDGNVKGGYGVVGGVFSVPFPYVFEEWPF